MLGVVAGTMVSEWREEFAANKTRDRALQSLANEVAQNRIFLHYRIDYYQSVIDGIESARSRRGKEAGLEDVPAMRGLNPPMFRRAAYDVSFHSGAFANFDFELAERVASTYAFQDWIPRMADMTAGSLVARGAGEISLDDLKAAFTDWNTMCRELLQYQEALARELPPADAFYRDRLATAPPLQVPAAVPADAVQ